MPNSMSNMPLETVRSAIKSVEIPRSPGPMSKIKNAPDMRTLGGKKSK